MNLTPGTTIESGSVITRQTIYDLWNLAEGGQVETTDLAAGVFPMIAGSSATGGIEPGTIWFDQQEQLWKVWVDVKDNTAVSVWVAWGPDRFDEIFIASEHLPPGSLFVLDGAQSGRYVKRAAGFGEPGGIGIVATTGTVVSGSWFAGTIEGFVKAWFPYKPLSDVSAPEAGQRANQSVFPIGWAAGGLGRSASGNLQNEFIVGVGLYTTDPVTTVSFGNFLEMILFTGSRYTKR